MTVYRTQWLVSVHTEHADHRTLEAAEAHALKLQLRGHAHVTVFAVEVQP